MWRIAKPELRPATLDFTSSEQGWRDVTQLFADKVLLINAVELVEWEEDECQFLVCEQCGFTHCKRGDWVRVRRSDSLVVILPSFGHVSPELEEDRAEYQPPKYLTDRGIPYFDRATYESLTSQHSSFPPFEQIPKLNAREAEFLSTWNAGAAPQGL
ncbi:MAG TPA: hypothetical protein VFO99_04870 [Pyrinomonadaceae bacterium]|nr:hypothetical protein [Pyrinomonadaceae bacterium]